MIFRKATKHTARDKAHLSQYSHNTRLNSSCLLVNRVIDETHGDRQPEGIQSIEDLLAIFLILVYFHKVFLLPLEVSHLGIIIHITIYRTAYIPVNVLTVVPTQLSLVLHVEDSFHHTNPSILTHLNAIVTIFLDNYLFGPWHIIDKDELLKRVALMNKHGVTVRYCFQFRKTEQILEFSQ